MKRLYRRVRLSVAGVLAHRPDCVIDLDTGRPLANRIPATYAKRMLAARPGARVKLWLYGDDPARIAYSRHRRANREIRVVPAVLRIVERVQ